MELLSKVEKPVNSTTWLAGFWTRPRQTWFRKVVFQIHLWAGLVIGLYALAIGVSGSALVFQDEIHAALEPNVYKLQVTDRRAQLQAVVDESVRRFPTHSVGGIAGFDEPDSSLVLWMNPIPPAGPEQGINIHFNPHTGEMLSVRSSYEGVLGWFANLHYFLLLGSTGAVVNGILAAVLLVLCVTGFVIWWPGRRNWRRGFRFNFRSSWKCVNWDLHSNGGFLLSALIAIFCLTGVYFEFPGAVAAGMAKLSGMSREEISPFPMPPKSHASSLKQISFDTAVEVGKRTLPQDALATYLIAPSGADGVYTLYGKYHGNPLLCGLITIYIDQYSGRVLGLGDSRKQSLGTNLLLMTYPIHFGIWGGVFVKCLWVLVGLAPGMLFLTGFLMWWNRVIRKKLRSLVAHRT